MSNFNHIQAKLHDFVKKYYKNELLKGFILFCSFGFLYFLFTLFIESILWLRPTARTILFWVFILVETVFLIKYIFLPLAKLMGLQKGITLKEASFLIGEHFNEIDDKLLNVLQLNDETNQSELLLASIEQKSKNLKPIPFKKAINFTHNSKYLKYLAIPVFILLVTFSTGNKDLFSASYNRVIHYQTSYEPPAPFSFILMNTDLNVIEGESIKIEIETRGNVIPEDVSIRFLNQNYFVKNSGFGKYEYTFSSIVESVGFYFESNGVRSKTYNILVISTPIITRFEMWLDYPSYTKKQDERIKNTGNALVPRGTNITWKLSSKNTNKVAFITEEEELFNVVDDNHFEFKKRVLQNVEYQISTSNNELKNYESLGFSIDVLQDSYPKIDVRSDIDSITRGPVQFVGQLSDDYGLSKLQLVYYDINEKANSQKFDLKIQNSIFEEFYYVFPDGIDLEEGITYGMYFEIFDNDGVNGRKSTKSKTFSYYKKTVEELKDQLLKEQQNSISDLEKTISKSKEVQDDFHKLIESLQNKSEMNWNDQKKLENFMQRQKQYENMMQRQTEQINQNLKEQPINKNKDLEERKKDIQQRLKEAKDLAKQDKLLDELKKLAEKFNKEELTEKLKKLTQNNRQNERNLERILELTKRFYVEQKANQITEKLDELSKKQERLSENKENTSEKQKELNSEFNDVKKDLDELDKENKKLQKPMNLPRTDREEKGIDKDMNEALETLDKLEKEETNEDEGSDDNKESKKKASRKQKSAAQKMKQMSQKMQSAMEAMQGESMDEDIEMLRAILENLLEFSFQQEDLMLDFSEIDNTHPEFANKLKKQHVLREYFEHIDDSLYTLSMRQPKIGTQIFKDLSDVHYHLEESLIHFTENQFNTGVSDQQFVMTSTNNIAFLLSNILNSMQNASPSSGQGKGDSFSLPDIIQKQGEAIEEMEEGIKKGDKKRGENEGKEGEPKEGETGDKPGNGLGEQMNGELYEIYKQQVELRRLLEEALKDKIGNDGKGVGKNALKQMEQLEQDLLEKGFTNSVLQKMMQLKYELLKLEEAAYKQGEDLKRESNTNINKFEHRNIKVLNSKKIWFNQNEILNRQSLPLQSFYKKKVQEYFRANDSIQ